VTADPAPGLVPAPASDRSSDPSSAAADLAALRRVASGDAEAFAQLVERHQVRLVRLCARLLRDPDEAQDAAQEVFLRAYRAAGTYEPRGAVFTWLYRIAVNHCLNRLRRRRLVRFLPMLSGGAGGEEPKGLDPPDLAPRSDRAVESRETWEAMRGAIRSLPANQQAVLLLAKFEQLSYREIAQALGITEGAVESRLVRAMRTLQRVLDRERAQESNRSGVSSPGRG
jgi:RNA polymerase sigma-70 factor (ECF subfamily)